MSDYKTFTSQDLMKAMGLQVGDIIGIFRLSSCQDEKYEICQHNNDVIYAKSVKYGSKVQLYSLISDYTQYKILPRPKRVGDLKCSEFDSCITCPLQWLCFRKIDEKNEMETTLYEMLENFVVKDQEIHDLLKARLDKEVKEYESNNN